MVDVNLWKAAWEAATPQERGQLLQQLVDHMGIDAFYDMLVDAFGEDELRRGLKAISDKEKEI